MALLHLAHRLSATYPFSLSALHVHHGLSPHADAWADFCATLCASLAVPLTVHRVTVVAGGEGVEAAARRARYAAFAGCDADILLLAHHRDDQGETVLFNLLRGAGPAGAAGMPGERTLARIGQPPLRLLRPLLKVTRADIDAWLIARGLPHVEDESNRDCRFARNFLRREAMPLLERHFPAAAGRLAAAGERFAEAAELLDELAAADAARVCVAGRIGLTDFANLSPARAHNLLRHLLADRGVMIPAAERLAEACRQLREATHRGALQIRFGDLELRSWRDYACLVTANASPPPAVCAWRGEANLPWAGGAVCFAAQPGGGLAAARLAAERVELRPRQGGERLRLSPTRPARPLNDWCQERQVPPWERSRIPLLWVGEKLAWVGGLGADVAFAAGADEAGWALSWQR